MYRYNHNISPISFNNKFEINKNDNYNLRANMLNTYKLPRIISKYSEYCISYRGPKVWNTFQKGFKGTVSSLSSFKFLTKKEIFKT